MPNNFINEQFKQDVYHAMTDFTNRFSRQTERPSEVEINAIMQIAHWLSEEEMTHELFYERMKTLLPTLKNRTTMWRFITVYKTSSLRTRLEQLLQAQPLANLQHAELIGLRITVRETEGLDKAQLQQDLEKTRGELSRVKEAYSHKAAELEKQKFEENQMRAVAMEQARRIYELEATTKSQSEQLTHLEGQLTVLNKTLQLLLMQEQNPRESKSSAGLQRLGLFSPTVLSDEEKKVEAGRLQSVSF